MPENENQNEGLWDKIGEHYFETGVDHGMLYLYDPESKSYGAGVPWNGLVSVTEQPSGAEPTRKYADNIPYVTLLSAEEYAATIECFTYPDEFKLCNGEASQGGVTFGQQPRRMFAFSYRTLVGSDTEGTNAGYKIHIIYSALSSPAEVKHSTVNDSPDIDTMSFKITTTPVAMNGMSPTATAVIDCTGMTDEKIASIENVMKGSLPAPDALGRAIA
jgi:hypothetical protein